MAPIPEHDQPGARAVVTIADYVRALEEALRRQRLPRRRLLLEVEAHLRDLEPESGETHAVERFGTPEELARRYAEVIRPRVARRILLAGTVATGALGAIAVWFATAASAIVWDFPQGAPTLLLVQPAVMALVAAAVPLRRGNLAAVARAVLVSTLAVAAAALAETALALARPAGFILWSEAPWLVVGILGTAVGSAAAAAASIDALRRERAVPPAFFD